MDVTILVAFLAGLLSFLSPCVLPLVPPYLCYLAGTTLDGLTTAEGEHEVDRLGVVLSAVAFVLGFATVFVTLGATASALGQLLAQHLYLLGRIAGVAIILMGAHFLGLFKFAFLYREARFTARAPSGLLGAYVMGLAFAFGWTPCVGPVLTAILSVAASEQMVWRGVGLLALYSLGLGVPFLLAAIAIDPFLAASARFRRYLPMVEKTMGGLLVVTGVLFLTGSITQASYWLLETFPRLGRIEACAASAANCWPW